MKKLLSLLIALTLSLTCVFAMTSCKKSSARDLDDILKAGQITMATNAEFAPFESKEGEEYVGIDIDIAEKIAEYLGVELVINNMDFDAVVTSVQNGQSDFAMAGLTISESRKKAIDFSDAYFGAAQYVVVKATDTTFDACQSKDDVDAVLATLSGNAAAQSGTTGYYYVKGSQDFGFNGFANLNAVSYESAAMGAMAVVNGQAKLLVVDDEVAAQIAATNTDVKVIPYALSSEEYGIGVNKSNVALTLVINKVLAELEQSGELAEIFARHTAQA